MNVPVCLLLSSLSMLGILTTYVPQENDNVLLFPMKAQLVSSIFQHKYFRIEKDVFRGNNMRK